MHNGFYTRRETMKEKVIYAADNTKTTSSNVCCKVLAFTTTFFAVSSVALTVYVVWIQVINKPDKTITKELLSERFPGYFWDKDQFLLYSNQLASRLQNVTKFRNIPKPCNTDCPIQAWYKRKSKIKRSVPVVSGGDLYHGCCYSQTFYESPYEKVNENGEERRFLALSDAKQYFKVSFCTQHTYCTGCQCMYEEEVNTAVVYKKGVEPSEADIDDLEIDSFKFYGCCKCVNDGSM